jgi:membrane protease subunit (stomatin/prohibitin family)
MALMDFIKKQFVDVIHWTEDDETTLAYRFPMQDMEIQYGAQLTVRESQMAAFVNEGQVADVFGPGRYKLTTQTIPVLTYLRNWDKLFQSPFKSDVYFFSTRLKVDQKWGTPNPITIRDKEFGAIRLRAFGIYSYRLKDPQAFHVNVSGTRERYSVDDLSGQLRSTIVGSITDLFAESQIPFLDMAAQQDELGSKLKAKVGDGFARLGLELDGFVVENLSLPEELQKILDKRIGMNIVGDMQRYTQYEVAANIGTAAANEGGLAGIGAGLGAGMGIGQAMGQALGQAMQPAGAQGTPSAGGAAGKDSPQDVMQLLEKLHDLRTKGVLSDDEFNQKKAELLKKLG